MPEQAAHRSRRITVAFFLVAAVIALIAAASKSSGTPAAAGVTRPVVRTTAGLVQGKDTGTQDEYLGIPYAAPPTGALRWRPPQPAAAWRTPYPGPLSASQQRLAQTMQRYWTDFAATGIPIAQWPRFTPASTQTVTLSPQGAVIGRDYAAEHHCGFWATAG